MGKFTYFLITSPTYLRLSVCSYKARGTIATDKNGTLDTVEFLNIAQDDAVSWPRMTHRTYPATVNQHMDDVIVPFVRKSISVNMTFLAFFERRLGLPSGELLRRHRPDELNGGEARCIRTPPRQTAAGIGAHTDFGSLVRIFSASIMISYLMTTRTLGAVGNGP